MDKVRAGAGNVLSALSAGTVAGFAVGLIVAVSGITAHRYVPQKMYRLVALGFRDPLNRWVAAGILIPLVLIFLFVLAGLSRRVFKAGKLKTRIGNGGRVRSAMLACLLFPLFFFWGGWAINHYWLPDVFSPVSLICNAALLALAVLLGGLMARTRWGTLVRIANRARGPACVLLAILLALNLWILILGGGGIDLSAPSVVLISIDTLRADRLGCYGYGRNTTPNIDLFSREAALFKNAITPRAETTQAMVSVLTGLYPHTHRVRTLGIPLRSRILTLQEILLNNGYTTAAFIGNWVLKKKYAGLHHGFETYDDELPDKDLNRDFYERKAPDINGAVFRWLDRNHDNKFFLWVHYQDVHGPYIAPEKYRELFDGGGGDPVVEELVPVYQKLPWVESRDGSVDADIYRNGYDAEILFCDEHVGGLLEKIDELGLKNVVVIITADHGESLGEHDYYFAHGKYVYDQCSRVPLLVRLPGSKGAKVIEKQVNIMDITPTLLEIAGCPFPPEIEGISLRPLIEKDESQVPEAPVFLERFNDIKAVRTGRWKYISNLHSNTEELYDLESDPEETMNVLSENADIAAGLKKVLREWMKESDISRVRKLEDRDLSEEDREVFRALGYL
ncbi:MAG: sulfatase [Candidatus Tritonobacter lacicola]|nr:sulfatase [Candidatus Tritonobacter lacicola]